MNRFTLRQLYRVFFSFFLCTGFMISASAAVLEEVVVTAQKREQSVQDVGISITAFNDQSIVNRGLDDAYQLSDAVPNLRAFAHAVGQNHFRIRGLGLNEFQVSFDAPVAINIDEVILSKPFMGSIGVFDVQRIEVLKGPQGTLFGRNTTGGAVNYYSNRPTEEFEAGIRLGYGRYDRFEVNAHVSGPLSENLSGRIAISGAHAGADEGPYLNLFNGKRIGTRDNKKQVRGMLQWANDTTTILASVHYDRDFGESVPYDNLFQDIPGGVQAGGTTDVTKVIRDPVGRFVVNQDNAPTKDLEAAGANLRIEHTFGEMTLTSLTAYEYFKRDAREDSDNTPADTVNIDWYSDINQFSQELRLSGEHGQWQYLVGAYYESDDLTSVNAIHLTDLGIPGLNTAGSDYAQKTNTWAIFSNVEYMFNEQLSLIAGLRYTEEKNHFTGLSFFATGLPGPGPKNRVDPSTYIPGLVSADEKRKDTDLNFKVGLNYHFSDDILLFASYSTGFRSGGFDAGLAADPLIIFEPEDVTAYEAGIKSTLLDGTLAANLSVFFTEVDNYQENANLPTELIPRRRNIGKLESKGVEVDLNWKPADAWLIRGSVGYADTEIVKSNFLFGTIPAEGNIPANSPKLSSNLFGSYVLPVSNTLDLEINASWTWVDKRFLEVENQPDHLVGSYNTVDASIAISTRDGKWRASFWARNLTDEIHLTYINDVPGFGLFLPINSDPLNYGVNVEYNF